MKTTRTLALLALSLPATAAAQTIFHDNFSGNALGPHWQLPDPGRWNHQVADGRLTVDWILPPDGSHGGTFNSAGIRSEFAPHSGDFDATIRAGWDAGELRMFRVALTTAGPMHRSLANIWYDEEPAGGPIIFFTGPWDPFPSPGPGMHDFRIARRDLEVRFYINDQLVTTNPIADLPLGRIGFDFGLSYPGQTFAPMHVDFVSIVPAPAGFWVLIAAAGAAFQRRRG